MSVFLGLRHSIRSILDRRSADQETREELAYHLERQTQKHIAAGLGPDEAARRAALELGGAERWRDETADARRGTVLHDVVSDTRYTLRGLPARPGFALSALATLAIGVGASTAVFAIAQGALLRPLPFRDADRLMSIVLRMPRGPSTVIDMVWSYPKFTLLRDRQTVFSSVALHNSETLVVSGADGAERLPAEMASATYFEMLGVRPALGRTFTADEDRIGGPNAVVVLSDGFWRTRFAANASVIGGSMTIGGVKHTIVGVMPPKFHGLSGDARFWIPVPGARTAATLQSAGAHNMELLGKLAPSVTPAAARQALESIGRQIDATYPDDSGGWGATAYSLNDLRVNGTIRRSIRLFGVAIALLLSIVCVNLTALLVTRGAARRQEFAVRVALGAGRTRLVRQLMTESFVLAALGGILGTALAVSAVRLLVSTLPLSMPTTAVGTDLTRLTFSEIRFDATALTFAFVLATLLGTGIGLASALRITGNQLSLALRQGSASPATGRRIGTTGALVVAQIALAVVFLIASGMTIESLRRTLAIPLGYEPKGLVTVKLTLDPARAGRDSNLVLWGALLNEVRALPGVRSAAVGSCAPVGMHCDGTSITPNGHANASDAMYLMASSEYFSALKTPIVRGRTFRTEDGLASQRVAIINRAAARAIWNGDDPLTTPIRAGGNLIQVVGVVEDARYGDIERPPDPAVFFPHASGRGVLFVRVDGDPAAIVLAIRRAVRRAGVGHAMGEARTMDAELRDATARNRLSVQVFTAFGLSALLLAAIGVYSTLALRVTQRTREFAIRRALGASAGSLARLVGWQAAAFGLFGGAAGVVLAWIVARALSALLYDVRALEPSVYGGAGLLLAIAVATAAAFPTARSLRVDPREAMRAE